MKLFEKVFLLVVGVVSMAFEEAEKAINETTHNLKEQGQKLTQSVK